MSNIVFCLSRIVLSHLSVIWVSKKIYVHGNALDLWDQVKGAKKRTLEAVKDWIAREGTRLNRNEIKSIFTADATLSCKGRAQKYQAWKFQYIFFHATFPNSVFIFIYQDHL